MEENLSESNNKSIIIDNESNFWRYSSEKGFDLTRQNDLQNCFSISFQTTTKFIRIDPARSALIIIDMQNYFLHPSIRLHEKGIAASEKLLQYVIPAARKANIQIIWLNWGLTQQDIDEAPPALKQIFIRPILNKSNNIQTTSKTTYISLGDEMGDIILSNGEHVNAGRLLMRDTWNTNLYDPLLENYKNSQKTSKPDQWFHKNRVSGLWAHDSPLLSYLQENKLITLFFAGVNTDQCVYITRQDAWSKGFDCILLRDACGTTSPSFAQECTEYNCAGASGFVMEDEQFAKGVEDARQSSS